MVTIAKPSAKLGPGKIAGLDACANEKGIIGAAAMDQRGSLRRAVATARGEGGTASAEDLVAFKKAVIKVLGGEASAILIDPEYGQEAMKARSASTGMIVSYEKSGYDTAVKGRLPDLLDEWSVRRIKEIGGHAIKILLYYNPFDEPKINTIKQAFIERIGAEAEAVDIPFFLEPLAYDDNLGDERSFEFAKVKPKYVTAYMEEFSKPRYGVDVLKVEVPINMTFVEGTRAFGGQAAYSRQEALTHFRDAGAAATKPFIYLSAGVTDAIFRETLELAAESGTSFSGVLCGRATWQDGIPVYAKEGVEALERWLAGRGVENIRAINTLLEKGAKPWWTVYGGRENVA
jgi:tagatose 1,6-diphosphate aldolase